MEAAMVAAERGHRVILAEKSDRLGGMLNFADSDHYKKELGAFKDVLSERVRNNSEISVQLNLEIKAENITDYGADVVIVAVGSEPVTPPIPGIDNAVKALDVYDMPEKIGKKVIMIGGGLVGCEVGLHLARSGRDVTVIEMQDEVSPDSYPMHRIGLINEIEGFIAADTVVYALGMKAKEQSAEMLQNAAGNVEVYRVGDCVSASKVYDAIRQGYMAAMSIL